MKKLPALLLIVIAVSTAFAETPSSASDAQPSPAERGIAQANRLTEKNPKNFEAYNALALSLSRRARETSDVTYYARAEEALQKSFAIAPDYQPGIDRRGKLKVRAGRQTGLREWCRIPKTTM